MEESSVFYKIGAGSFADVFVWQGRDNMAIKRVADPARNAEVRKEFDDLTALYTALSDYHIGIPSPLRYHSSFSEFKQRIRFVGDVEAPKDSASLYIMERIWPLPNAMQATIREELFPAAARGGMGMFIARIYLGRPRDRTLSLRHNARFFNRCNFPLDTDDLDALRRHFGALETPEGIAVHMGRLLAGIHGTGRDGRDIEFVLGCSRADPFEQHGLFCIDFNQLQPHNGDPQVLVDSFVANDPYYPRPGMRAWESFQRGYLSEAVVIRPEFRELAAKFLDGVKAAYTIHAMQPDVPATELSTNDDADAAASGLGDAV